MTSSRSNNRRLARAALLVAAAAVSIACSCIHGGSHHALGDDEHPTVAPLTTGGCCSAKQASGSAQHGDHDHGQTPPKAAKAEFHGDPYLLGTDSVSGEELGPIERQVIIEHEGRELRFANQQNATVFRADPAKYLAKIDEALIKQQTPFYPLETCPVSGEKLGGMGEPVNFVHRNRLVRLCCDDCKSDFLKDPAKYVAKLDAAVVESEGKAYPSTTCIVSGEVLGGEMGDPVDHVIGNRLVRLCCEDCVKKLRQDPLTYLAKLGPPKQSDHGLHDRKDREHDHGDHK